MVTLTNSRYAIKSSEIGVVTKNDNALVMMIGFNSNNMADVIPIIVASS